MKKYRLIQEYRTPSMIIPAGTIGRYLIASDQIHFVSGEFEIMYSVSIVNGTPDWFEEVKVKPEHYDDNCRLFHIGDKAKIISIDVSEGFTAIVNFSDPTIIAINVKPQHK